MQGLGHFLDKATPNNVGRGCLLGVNGQNISCQAGSPDRRQAANRSFVFLKA
jgi:hypothetical protein